MEHRKKNRRQTNIEPLMPANSIPSIDEHSSTNKDRVVGRKSLDKFTKEIKKTYNNFLNSMTNGHEKSNQSRAIDINGVLTRKKSSMGVGSYEYLRVATNQNYSGGKTPVSTNLGKEEML